MYEILIIHPTIGVLLQQSVDFSSLMVPSPALWMFTIWTISCSCTCRVCSFVLLAVIRCTYTVLFCGMILYRICLHSICWIILVRIPVQSMRRVGHKIVLKSSLHCEKRLSFSPSLAGMSLTKLSLAGNNLIIPAASRPGRVWLVTSRLGTGKTITFFTVYRCRYSLVRSCIGKYE